MNSKKIVALVLLTAMSARFLAGCETADPESRYDISVRQAFRTSAAGDGNLDPDSISFYKQTADLVETATVALDEVIQYTPPYPVPHTGYYEQFLPDGMMQILPIIEYAIAHEYSRICIPSEEFNYGMFGDYAGFLIQTYLLEFNAMEVASFTMEDGHTLRYMLLTMHGLEASDRAEYRKTHEAAWEIVRSMPPSCQTDLLKAQYLFHYLTENVELNDVHDKPELDSAYDALIGHKTTRAGFAVALFCLYNLAEIECIYLRGYRNDVVGVQWRAWNAAKIDGNYYLFDSSEEVGKEIPDYRVFGISNDAMLEYNALFQDAELEKYNPVCSENLPGYGFPEDPSGISDKKVDLGLYTYYLDTGSVQSTENESGYMLYKVLCAGGPAISMDVLAYDIIRYGDHIFFLVNNSDSLSFPEFSLNSVYRIDSDDETTLICTGYDYNTFDDAIKQYENNLYFTRYNESAVYRSDLNGENILQIPISYSEDQVLAQYAKTQEPPTLYKSLYVDKIEDDCLFLQLSEVNENSYAYVMTYLKKSLIDEREEKIFTKVDDSTDMAGDWLYYLGDEIPGSTDDESEMEEYPMYELHRAKLDGSADENLRVPCFDFDFAGEYLYVDTNLVWGDFSYWDTSRYNLDGTGQTPLEFGNMNRYSEGDRMYFTGFDDTVIRVADTACNVLAEIPIQLPDKSDVLVRLAEVTGMENFEFAFVDVADQEEDWLYFDFHVTSTSPFPYYFLGYYRVNLTSLVVEKVSAGQYYKYYPSE